MSKEKLAIEIIKTLQDNGHEAVFAGGCVRDRLLNVEPHDYDIATSAKPYQVEELFEKTIPTGKQFGVINVIIDDNDFEVATFRSDGCYQDGRHPINVKFCSMETDSKRRDFTINGMFYDPIKDKLYDFVGGQEDLASKTLRFIGDAHDRINEDKLRILRTIRFAIKLNFKIESESWFSIIRNAYKITDVSWERIQEEFYKILDNTIGIINMWDMLKSTFLLLHILPELYATSNIPQNPDYHPEGSVEIHTMYLFSKLNYMQVDTDTLFAGLLHDVGKVYTTKTNEEGRIISYGHEHVGANVARRICERFKLSNKSSKKIIWLVENHMKLMHAKKMRKSKLKMLMAHEYFEDLLKLHEADCLASSGNIDTVDCIKQKKIEFAENKEEIKPKLLIGGDDLRDLGFKPGKIYGEILKKVYEQQLENHLTCREEALNFVKENYLVGGIK